jgi:uncharacterized SAM-binding protein YcdF (DUF218 family)
MSCTAMSDAVIVLGAAVWAGGKPSPTLLRRTQHGAALVLRGKAPFLIVTGGTGRHPPAEALVMRDIAIGEGVAEHAIIVEDQGKNTLESGRACRAIMRSRVWTRALIVTDDFHISRTLLIFRSLGIEAEASAAPGARRYFGPARWAFYWLRELAAWPWTLLRLVVQRRAGDAAS